MKKQYKCKRMEFLDILKQEGSIYAALEITNTEYKTIYTWTQKYKWFKTELMSILIKDILLIQHKLLEKIKDGENDAIKTFLRHADIFNVVNYFNGEMDLPEGKSNGFWIDFNKMKNDK